jgi:hypothetical protein
VQSQIHNVVVVRRCSKTPANWRIFSEYVSCLFAVVRVGWCTTGVNKSRRNTSAFAILCERTKDLHNDGTAHREVSLSPPWTGRSLQAACYRCEIAHLRFVDGPFTLFALEQFEPDCHLTDYLNIRAYISSSPMLACIFPTANVPPWKRRTRPSLRADRSRG